MSLTLVYSDNNDDDNSRKNNKPVWQDAYTRPVIELYEFISESWADIPGFNGKYRISTLGRVRNVKTGNILRYGYKGTTLLYPSVNLGGRSYYVHRLVAEAFLGDVPGYEVDHINGHTFDSRLSNLRYVTAKQNHKYRENRRRQARAEGRIFESGTGYQSITPGECPEGHELERKDTVKELYVCKMCRSENNKRNIDFVKGMLEHFNNVMVYTPYSDPITEEPQLDVAA